MNNIHLVQKNAIAHELANVGHLTFTGRLKDPSQFIYYDPTQDPKQDIYKSLLPNVKLSMVNMVKEITTLVTNANTPSNYSAMVTAQNKNKTPLSKALTYEGTPTSQATPWTAIKFVPINPQDRYSLHHIGFDRFNSTLVRNLIFLTNVQRLLSFKLGQRVDEDYGIILKNGFSTLYANS